MGVLVTDEIASVAPVRQQSALARTATRRVLIAVVLTALAAVTLLDSLGRTPVDIKPEVYLAPWRAAVSYLSPWQANPYLGMPSFNVGLAPVAVFVGIIQLLGVSPGVSAHLVRGLLAAVLGWGAARLYREFVPAAEGVGALAAAVVAVANPYTLTAGSTLAISLPLALLPWQLVAVVRAVREPGWRYPALIALTFFAMSGANAGVVPLLQGLSIPVVAVIVARADGLGSRRAVTALARAAVLTVLVSLYWLVPAVSATAAGTTVLGNSESPTGIASVSSFAEVLRGLGLWPLYGSDQNGPWQPGFVPYLDNWAVLTASFAFPVLLAVAVAYTRGLVRRVSLWLVLPAVVVMVGLNPPSSPSPFGRALRWTFDNVPALAAFRTTNKIGAMYVLGLALLLAAGFVHLLRRLPSRAQRGWVALGLSAILLAATAPAWAGNMYTSFVDVPGYWRQAAAALNHGSDADRVWFVPGETLSHYRWSDPRPDDLSLALLTRPSLVRTVIPVSGAEPSNLLAAVDTGLQEGWLAPGSLSVAARYLGADTLLLRNDQVWEDDGGARPQVLQDVIGADPGLTSARNYGRPGENVADARASLTPAEASLPPLQQWRVADPQPILRALPAKGGVLVAGDGYALDELVAAGAVDGKQPIRYLGDLRSGRSAQLAQAIDDAGRIVLTDTNRRRSTARGSLTDAQGPLLPADQGVGDTRALWGARDQTVLEDSGASVTATQDGSVFGPLPYTAPENAFDGDPATSWEFGDFRTGDGATISARFATRLVPSVTVHANTDGVHMTSARLTLSGAGRSVRATVPVGPSGIARWRPPAGTRANRLGLQVASEAGAGFNRLSISEITIPGLHATRVAKLPDTLTALLANNPKHAALISRTPIDVMLARVVGRTGTSADDEEMSLNRDFSLPVARTYRSEASIRVAGDVDDRTLDRLAGASGAITAQSTSRLFDDPSVRASSAVDGNPRTAWVPGLPATGQSITISAPPRRISELTLTQTAQRGGPPNAATLVRIRLDGRAVRDAAVHLGRNVIRVPAQRAGRLSIEILRALRPGVDAPIRFAEIGFGGARIGFDKQRASHACVDVGTIDGRPMALHPTGTLAPNSVVPARGCGTFGLSAGMHRVRGDGRAALVLDRLTLTDTLHPPTTSTDSAPRLSSVQHGQTDYTIQVRGGTGPYWLALGQAFDPRWRASIDGHSLGTPQPLNGWETGWRIASAGGTHTITVEYGPRRAADVAMGISVGGLLLCALLALRPVTMRRHAYRRRRLEHHPAAPRAGNRSAVVRGWRYWAAVVGCAALFGGWLAAAAAVTAAGWYALSRPSGRRIALTAAVVFAAVPLLWIVLRPHTSAITPALITGNPWPGRAAMIGLLLVVIAATIDRADRREVAP